MSIIQDALRKAQPRYKTEREPDRDRAAQEAISVKAAPHGAKTVKPENTNKAHQRTIFLVSAALFILAVSGGIYFNRIGHVVKSDKMAGGAASDDTQPRANVSIPDAAPVTESPAAGKAPDLSKQGAPRFLLNGIMYLDEGPQAIINGAVVKEGDVVNGAAVVKINRNNVLMKFKDEEIVLRLT